MTQTSAHKQWNSTSILELIRSEQGLSRTELAEATELSPSTISSMVRKLLADGSIEQTAGTSTGGRRPRLLRAAAQSGLVQVAELGTLHARVGLADLSGQMLDSHELPIDSGDGPGAVLDELVSAWESLHHKNDLDPAELRGTGLAVPAPVNRRQDRVAGAARLPGWGDISLRDELQQRLGGVMVLENDARAGAVGVHASEDRDDFLYVKAGTGIGGALLWKGRPHRGSQGFGGDLTHTWVPTAGRHRCSCGNTGCLETIASGAGILARLAEDGLVLTGLGELAERTEAGDPRVSTRVRTAGGELGRVLAGLVNFLNPGALVLGGALSSLGAFMAGVRAELYSGALPICSSELTIDTAHAGADAALDGMAVLVREKLTNQSDPAEGTTR